MKSVKLYVVAIDGRMLPDYGTRQYGEYFELPEAMAAELAVRDDFSLDDPNRAVYEAPVVNSRAAKKELPDG